MRHLPAVARGPDHRSRETYAVWGGSIAMPRLLLALAVLLAATARATLLFSTELMPGMNGAYYLVQARSLLEKGALAIPDLPLVFALHAAMAGIIDGLTPSPKAMR